MPSFTFSSTANAVALRGGVPVFVDVRPDTLNIDERLIEAAITSRTKAVFAVHYAGVPCALDEISLICKRHNLLLVEDVAQGAISKIKSNILPYYMYWTGFLSKYKGRALGTIGDFGCFSFHYTKNIICGEGGALLVNSSGFVERALRIWEKGTNR